MKSEMKNIIFNTLFGFSFCILIGFLMYGTTIFYFHNSRSQLFLFGLYGATFYSMLKFGKLKETLVVAIIIFLINLLLQGKSLKLNFIIRDAVFFSSIFSALVLYKIFIEKYSNLPLFYRGFALSLFLGILNVIATLLLTLIFNSSSLNIRTALFLNAQYAALIGIGLGIGFDIFEKYHDKIF